MFHHTYAVCLLTFFLIAGELPKELGNLVKLTVLRLNDNQFRGELYVPYYIRNFAMHITEFLCMFCTVTEDEKAALKKKHPGRLIFY